MPKRTAQERFWSKVDKGQECWLWTASVTGAGYGQFYIAPTMRGSHRISYEWLVGPIPLGLDLDHLCRIRHCVNPGHLEPVTRSENNQRGLLSALRVPKTHCPGGHPYDGGNTYVNTLGRSVCRECKRTRSREWMRAKRASEKA